MDLSVVVCGTCGAFVPAQAAAATACGWCGALLGTDRSRLALVALSELVSRALRGAFDRNATTIDALRAALDAYLGVAGAGETAARVAVALASDFETQEHVNVQRDVAAMTRIAEASARAVGAVRAGGRARVELPFLVATSTGHAHLSRELTLADVTAMSAR